MENDEKHILLGSGEDFNVLGSHNNTLIVSEGATSKVVGHSSTPVHISIENADIKNIL